MRPGLDSDSVTVLVPALNEEDTVATVVRSSLQAGPVDTVVVVDNGSIDRTASRARAAGALVVSCPQTGKAEAVRAGVSAISGSPSPPSVVVLLDADLIDFSEQHLLSLLAPLQNGRVDMVCGVLWRRALRPLLTRLPVRTLTGQRAIRFDVLNSLDLTGCSGYELEVTLAGLIDPSRTALVCLDGVSHIRREQKRSRQWAGQSTLPARIVGAWMRLGVLIAYLRLWLSRRRGYSTAMAVASEVSRFKGRGEPG